MAHNSFVSSDPEKEFLPDNDKISIYEQSAAERDAAERNYDRYFHVRGRGHLDYIREANRCDQFYRGEQWTAADRAALESEGRPAMTVNMILTAINSVKGEYSNKRADFKFKPKRDGATVQQAIILNKVIMHEMDDIGYDDIEGDMFLDGLITDRGYLDVRMSTEDNIAGEIDVALRDPRSVIPDPDASGYDPKTWRDVITTEFMSLEEIGVKWGPEKAKLVRMNVDTIGRFEVDSVEFTEDTTFGEELGLDIGADNGAYYGTHDTAERSTVANIRIIDRQFWQVGTFKYFVNPEVQDSVAVPVNWTEEKAMAHAQQHGLEIVEKSEKRVRWTVSADRTLLFDDWSPYATFTIVPFFPYFRRGHPIGMVRNLLSSQEILNKTTSQMLHVTNTTANSGWVVEAGALTNMTADDLANKGSKSGVVIEVNPGKLGSIDKIRPNPVPTGIDAIANNAMGSIYEISGVNRSMMGQDGPAVAGVAIQERKNSALVQLQPVFDNLSRSRRMVGRKLIEMIQNFYTDERVFMISDYKNANADPEEVSVNQQVPDEEMLAQIEEKIASLPPEQQQEAMLQVQEKFQQQGPPMTIVNDLTLGKYGVVVASTPARDVYNEGQFAEALSLRQAGVEIPDYRILGFSNLDNKEEIAEESKQMAGLAPPTEEQQQMQQMQEEIHMQMIQLQLENQAATTELTQAQTQLAQAKAMEAADTPALEREKLELEATITAIEQATRERVNRVKEMSAQMKSIAANRNKLEVEGQRIVGNMANTALSNKNQPTKSKSEK